MQKDFYEKKLYPLQDKILEKINKSKNNFYLTGGTALSRFYLNHRYSDDLDFFVNDDSTFSSQVQNVQNELSEDFTISISKKDEQFARFFVEANDLKLKLEFINDVPFYLGELNSFRLFKRVDNILNILSNKISALPDREEPKDIADILLIYENQLKTGNLNWELIFSSSQSKAAGIFPPLIAEKIEIYKIENLKILNWIEAPDYAKLEKLKTQIVKDILGIF